MGRKRKRKKKEEVKKRPVGSLRWGREKGETKGRPRKKRAQTWFAGLLAVVYSSAPPNHFPALPLKSQKWL
jgi:hypothetical protein